MRDVWTDGQIFFLICVVYSDRQIDNLLFDTLQQKSIFLLQHHLYKEITK